MKPRLPSLSFVVFLALAACGTACFSTALVLWSGSAAAQTQPTSYTADVLR